MGIQVFCQKTKNKERLLVKISQKYKLNKLGKTFFLAHANSFISTELLF